MASPYKIETSDKSHTVSLDVSQLPSVQQGMTVAEESNKRRRTCRFLEEAGRILKLPRVAIATSMVFFHRFYAKHSFQEHDRFEVAVASLLLAAKTEEAPKKLKDVLEECTKLRAGAVQSGRVSGQPASPAQTTITGPLDSKSKEFAQLKERILLLERVILHTIGFEISISLPYRYFDLITKLIQTRQLEYAKPTNNNNLSVSQTMSKMTNELVQYSMNFANDSMHTTLCLQFSSQAIATSCIYLAARFSKVQPAANKEWLQVLPCDDVEAFVSICVQIMEVIVDRKGSLSASFADIKRELEQMRGTEASLAEKEAKRPRIT